LYLVTGRYGRRGRENIKKREGRKFERNEM
jgi:hypothetical protein